LPPGTFTSTASLKTAAEEFNANAASAIATYGPIADWDVSAITDMSQIFYNLANFNEDISSWETSGVTNVQYMFYVRSDPTCPPAATDCRPAPLA
jgi:surface protein